MTIRTFNTPNFTVRVEAQEDYDVDLSFDETGEVRAQIKSGELECFTVKASVEFRGSEIATDYLGGCIYKSPRDFMDHKGIKQYVPPGGKAGQCGSYFSDMVRNVCIEAREAISDTQSIHIRK